jgi:hypothetical protein
MEPIPAEEWAEHYKGVSDEVISAPLWTFLPANIPHVMHERRQRNILQLDPEPIGDPEYS